MLALASPSDFFLQRKQETYVMAETTPLRPEYGSLPELAQRIKAAHAAVLDASKNVVLKAIAAGTALREAKAKMVHGEWLPWLKDNCDLSGRTAHRYMQLAAGQHKLQSKFATMANLTLTQALKFLEPDAEKEDQGPSAKYDKAATTLIKKLQDLLPEEVEEAAHRTIQELEKAVAAVKPTAVKAAA
jgi:Protein of unknown function (DUF3102)